MAITAKKLAIAPSMVAIPAAGEASFCPAEKGRLQSAMERQGGWERGVGVLGRKGVGEELEGAVRIEVLILCCERERGC